MNIFLQNKPKKASIMPNEDVMTKWQSKPVPVRSNKKLTALSVVDDEGGSDVVDAIAVEGTACRTACCDIADIVQVVCPLAVLAVCVASDLQDQRLGDVIILIAVGTGSVVAYHTRGVLAHLWDGEPPHDKSGQSKIVTTITSYSCEIDIGRMVCCIGE